MAQLRVLAGEPLLVIDFRYHLVSLIAVFLAVALGIVIGTTQLNGGVLDNLKGQVTTLEQSKRSLEDQTQSLRVQADSGAAFEQAVGPTLVRGALTGRSVLLVVASDKVPPETVQAVSTLVGQAGGAVSGTIRLQGKYTDPATAPTLQSYVSGSGLPAGVTLPATADTAKLTATLLGQVLMIPAKATGSTPSSAAIASVLSGLSSLGVLTADGPSVAPANSAIVLTTGTIDTPDAETRNAALVDLAAALDAAGSGAVIAGDGASAGQTGLVGVVRADRGASAAISTVDNVDVPAGQISGILALVQERQGTSGRYGSAKGVQPLPPLPTATP
jgi:hypothetical protein